MKRVGVFLAIVWGLAGCALTPDEIQHAQSGETTAVVFDIDGTLTPDVTSVFEVRPCAAQSVQLYAEKGYEIIYLSARIKLLQSNIPDWLEKHNFPEGSIHVPETSEDGKDHAAFKTKVLKEYTSHGWKLAFAYGDSSTDFEAYSAVGIPREHIYALQRKGDNSCQTGTYTDCLKSWDEHLEFIKSVDILE